jgi:hypothetical protein
MQTNQERVRLIDVQIKQAKNDMVMAGELPAGRPRVGGGVRVPDEIMTLEDGTKATLRYHRVKQVWQMEVVDPDGQRETREASTVAELTEALLNERGQAVVERQEIEAENARIDAGLLPGQEDFDSPESQEVSKWFLQYHFGQEYQSLLKYLSEEDQTAAYYAIRGALGARHLPMTAANLDFVYRELVDRNDKFYALLEKSMAESQRQADEAAAIDAANAEEGKRDRSFLEPASPYAGTWVPGQGVRLPRVISGPPIVSNRTFDANAELTPRQLAIAKRKKLGL